MSYNGSGTFSITTTGQPVVTGTVISSTAFNALTADLATGLSTAITKDGQTTTTARILFAQGISSTLVTDATSATTGSIITAGGISTQKALWVGTTSNFAGAMTAAGATFSGTVGIGAGAILGGTRLLSVYNTSATSTTAFANPIFRVSSFASGADCTIELTDGATYTYYVSGVQGALVLRGGGGGDVRVGSDNSFLVGTTTNAGAGKARIENGLGIGMTPVNILDITQTQDGASIIGFKNASTGTSGRVDLRLYNSSNLGILTLFGTGFTAANVLRSGGVLLQGDGSGGVTLNTGAAQPIYFGINSTEAARFDTSGNLLVGGTTASGKLTVTTTGGNGVYSVQTSAGAYPYQAVALSNGGTFYYMAMSGGTGGAIYNNGTITTYAATSDERIKDWAGIVQSDKRQMISDLWLGDFDIYDDFTKTGTPHRGFGVRAQQAYGVLGEQFGFARPEKETDKWQAPSEPMAYLSLWGVKDLYKIIDELTTRLAALESK